MSKTLTPSHHHIDIDSQWLLRERPRTAEYQVRSMLTVLISPLSDLAATYAALILADEELEITVSSLSQIGSK